MTNLEKAIKELLSGKKFEYEGKILYYSKDNWFPFVSENPDADVFEPREYSITTKQFDNFDKWEEHKEDKSMDLLIESIEEGSGTWCWVGYKYNDLSYMAFINGYSRDRKIFSDQDLNEWKYVKPVLWKDLENLKEELLC